MYKERHPPGRLQAWVECAYSIEPAVAVAEHRVPPDGCLDINYSPSTGLVAVGAMTVERQFAFAAGARAFGVRFRTGMAGAFLGAAPGELTDRIVPLEELWGARARALQERAENAGSVEEAVDAVFEALRPAGEAGNVQRAIAAMAAMRGMANLEWLARQANLSERQFRRRCEEESGMTPKLLARVLRFREASRLAAEQERVDWAAVAAEAGYFDQAHLIRDFREFTGRTPMAVFSNTREGAGG